MERVYDSEGQGWLVDGTAMVREDHAWKVVDPIWKTPPDLDKEITFDDGPPSTPQVSARYRRLFQGDVDVHDTGQENVVALLCDGVAIAFVQAIWPFGDPAFDVQIAKGRIKEDNRAPRKLMAGVIECGPKGLQHREGVGWYNGERFLGADVTSAFVGFVGYQVKGDGQYPEQYQGGRLWSVSWAAGLDQRKLPSDPKALADAGVVLNERCSWLGVELLVRPQ